MELPEIMEAARCTLGMLGRGSFASPCGDMGKGMVPADPARSMVARSGVCIMGGCRETYLSWSCKDTRAAD